MGIFDETERDRDRRYERWLKQQTSGKNPIGDLFGLGPYLFALAVAAIVLNTVFGVGDAWLENNSGSNRSAPVNSSSTLYQSQDGVLFVEVQPNNTLGTIADQHCKGLLNVVYERNRAALPRGPDHIDVGQIIYIPDRCRY